MSVNLDSVIASMDGAGAGKRRKVEQKDGKAMPASVVYMRPVYYELDLRTTVAGPIKVGCFVCSCALYIRSHNRAEGQEIWGCIVAISGPRTKNMGVQEVRRFQEHSVPRTALWPSNIVVQERDGPRT